MTLGGVANRQVDPSVAWAGLAWFRSLWKGPLVLKGVLTAADARRAADHGVDGLMVSNHGVASSTDARLRRGAAGDRRRVGDRVEVLLDGGVRRGAGHGACPRARGASRDGRPAVFYGLGAGGSASVRRALDILAGEVDHALALVGVPRVRTWTGRSSGARTIPTGLK